MLEKNKTKIVITAFIVIVGLVWFLRNEEPEITNEPQETTRQEVVGRSVEGRDIKAYTYGTGKNHLLFIGGIHGGYEWNSVLLAYQFIDYLENKPNEIPENIKISIIPSANPDGLFEIIGKVGEFSRLDVQESDTAGKGRFNANDIDLNRNFDCKWQPESTWKGNPVSAGIGAFSEPEAKTIRDFVFDNDPVAVVFWHSQSNAVYASECEEGILPETIDIMNAYSDASGYRAIDTFDAYEITGDAEGWLASIGIPAITVELSNHETTDWNKNLAGVKALFDYYSN